MREGPMCGRRLAEAVISEMAAFDVYKIGATAAEQ
jgi:hypothetical protein